MAEKKFIPEWTSTPPLPGSYRSIAKQGAMDEIKLPSERYYKLLKGELGVDDSYFSGKRNDGNMPVRLDEEVDVPGDVVDALVKISGSENVRSDSYSRVKYSHGKLQEEMFNLKRGVVHEAAGVVVHPRDKEEVKEIIHLCDSKGVAVNVYGGGSSCNKGFLPERGGVTLVMNTHMKRVLEVNEKNHTCRVQAGCMGPDLENALNNARTLYGTTHAFTCGHFPQSFEISSVAGWSMALGSGQASTYYGDAADLVLAMEVVTPAGVINTSDYISTATGPKVVEMMKGSEGVFGVCVELTIKI
ncbi:MAG TPA: FAD-binding oxidoreductase, partial [Spirochaetota bacterium]|nr:FAD-binding oxidoreductase [Spirochaetota bacterium]